MQLFYVENPYFNKNVLCYKKPFHMIVLFNITHNINNYSKYNYNSGARIIV